MSIDYLSLTNEQRNFIEKMLFHDKKRFLLTLSHQIRKIRKSYLNHSKLTDPEQEFLFLAQLVDEIDRNSLFRFINKIVNKSRDIIFNHKNKNNTSKIFKAIKKTQSSYIAIVAIIKNEASYIREWIAYNRVMGVDHIYLFDNGSTDNIYETVQSEVEKGYVSIFPFNGKNAQVALYRFAARSLRKKYRWVAIIDPDEFILPSNGTIREYLKKMEQFPAIGINWRVFGPGGHKTRPDGLVIENYFDTFEDENNLMNLRIKTVVNPDEIYDITSSHFVILKKSRYAVDEDGEEITTKWMYISGSGPAFTGTNKTKKIRINHYWTKSEQEVKEKVQRGYPGNISPVFEDIMKRVDFSQKKDYCIKPYIELVRQELAKM